jgi:hypothetical protein
MNRSTLVPLLDREITDYEHARHRGDAAAAWRALERAHILSQPILGPHVRVHVTMLGYAVHQRDGREIVGQLARLALAPLGTLTGRIPWGNTGRSDVSAFEQMPLPADLREHLEQPTR